MVRLLVILLIACITLLVSGCGVRGDLERPPPIWGEDRRSETERKHEAEQD